MSWGWRGLGATARAAQIAAYAVIAMTVLAFAAQAEPAANGRPAAGGTELGANGRLVSGGAGSGTMDLALVQAYQNNPQLNAQRSATRAIDENVPTALAGYRPRVTGT